MKKRLYCNDCKTELTLRGEVFTHYNHDVVEIKEESERSPFPEFKDLPKIFIGEMELNPRDLKIGKLKKSKRVTKFSRYGR